MVSGLDSVYLRIKAINERIKEINEKVGNIYSSLDINRISKTQNYNITFETQKNTSKTFKEILDEALSKNNSNQENINILSKPDETWKEVIVQKNSNENRESKFDDIIQKASSTYNVPKELIKAVIKAESNFNPFSISPKNAMGLMQLLPSTAKEMGVEDVFDPFQNIMGGTKYLKTMLDKYNGNLFLALSAYNAGPNRVDKSKGIPEIEETQNYVDRVIKFYKEYSKIK